MVRLDSVIENAIGANTEALSYIYAFLLREMDMDFYKYIHINHIGNDLEEVIIRRGKEVYINIRYTLDKNFAQKSNLEKQTVFLDIMQNALLRLADKDKRIEISKLQSIKERIQLQRFEFEIIYKSFVNKKKDDLIANVLVHPQMDKFEIYILIEEKRVPKCKLLIYKGIPSDYYIDRLFSTGKWKGLDEFILTGKRSEIEIHVSADTCSLKFVNKSVDENKAPLFEAMKADADKDKTLKDYIASLNPAIAAMLTSSLN
ncbi:hypothetical protein [uncultured Chitinophaga sp.]|jgi:hypothetical protein|uniref:hypothetical protein n=1 Tax=uncultured Chitinophaga sp. TaxID=339340 RepID=UPI00260916D3|nr:hypothetical protein [uncultured Chitinophaga sp.]